MSLCGTDSISMANTHLITSGQLPSQFNLLVSQLEKLFCTSREIWEDLCLLNQMIAFSLLLGLLLQTPTTPNPSEKEGADDAFSAHRWFDFIPFRRTFHKVGSLHSKSQRNWIMSFTNSCSNVNRENIESNTTQCSLSCSCILWVIIDNDENDS